MDPARLGRLIDAHAAALVLYARAWCDAAEDVVQDAFLKLAALPAEPDSPAAWLFRAVRNAAVSAGRAGRRRRRHEAAAARPDCWFAADDAPGGLDAAAAADALARLPADEREVIVARLWGGLTFEQAGKLTGVSAATAHRRYAAGLDRLREILGVPCPPTKNP